jgi:hypothetical protein
MTGKDTCMSVRTVSLALATTLVVPLAAAPARANSITTYGVIVTAMGNELQVQTVDKPTGDPSAAGTTCPINTAGDTGGTDSTGGSLKITPDGSGGINITPFNGGTPSGIVAPPGTGSTGNDGGTGSGGSGSGGDGASGGGSTTDGGTTKVEFTSPADGFTPPGAAHLPPKPVTGTANTPEPASVTLLALAGIGGLIARRRRR